MTNEPKPLTPDQLESIRALVSKSKAAVDLLSHVGYLQAKLNAANARIAELTKPVCGPPSNPLFDTPNGTANVPLSELGVVITGPVSDPPAQPVADAPKRYKMVWNSTAMEATNDGPYMLADDVLPLLKSRQAAIDAAVKAEREAILAHISERASAWDALLESGGYETHHHPECALSVLGNVGHFVRARGTKP